MLLCASNGSHCGLVSPRRRVFPTASDDADAGFA
jgi:hypothetical protein